MVIWKVECAHSWEKDNEYSTYSFGSYTGVIEWAANNVEDLKWVSIMKLEYLPCEKSNPEGQLYMGCDFTQFWDKKELKSIEKVVNDLC